MAYALFLGCKIPYFVPQYEAATRVVLSELGVDVVDIEFGCCGYPMRNLYPTAHLQAAARAMALAEAQGLDLLTPCMCCLGSLKWAAHQLAQQEDLTQQINSTLKEEGLTYQGRSQVKHLVSVLYHDLGIEVLEELITRPLKGLKVAVQYGCHALRPSRITQFDHPTAPVIIDELVELTGAQSVPWAGRLLCCGSSLRSFNPELSLSMIQQRLRESREGGADLICISCTHTKMQADWAFQTLESSQLAELIGGTVLYPQLLGLSLGISSQILGPEAQAIETKLLSSASEAQASG
ncbi:MAG: CoB--CoM heterodisulfide reductase iron-sulfur subunit B family protein [Desulfarculaceae bacterium]|jgi:heterodisulfide reductase subunit B